MNHLIFIIQPLSTSIPGVRGLQRRVDRLVACLLSDLVSLLLTALLLSLASVVGISGSWLGLPVHQL